MVILSLLNNLIEFGLNFIQPCRKVFNIGANAGVIFAMLAFMKGEELENNRHDS
jgi:hypothetical protein